MLPNVAGIKSRRALEAKARRKLAAAAAELSGAQSVWNYQISATVSRRRRGWCYFSTVSSRMITGTRQYQE